jgi:hypothetical protein
VVRDGTIVTSMKCPYVSRYEGVEDLTGELTRQLVAMLSEAQGEQARP